MTEALKKTCRTPTQGRRGTTRIPLWKYQCVRRATVKLNMEVEGELTRVPNLKPQTLRKVD